MSTSDTVFNHPTTEGTLGEGVGLSKSNTSNLSTCYPNSPIHQASPVITIDGTSATLTADGSSLEYKQHYYNVCMRGESESLSFGTQDMSYGTSGIEGVETPPDYSSLSVEDETAPNSTVSASGLGPNASTDPSSMADVKPTATQPNPFDSSELMAAASTEITSKFDMGSSFASSIADEIGHINSGQSAPVAAGDD